MTNFYQLNFNIPDTESTYLYEHFTQNTQFGNITLIVGVKQNVDKIGITNDFFNTIKEAFIKLEGYNLDLYQRCLTVEEYQELVNNLGEDMAAQAFGFYGVLDTRQQSDNIFSIYFFDNRS